MQVKRASRTVVIPMYREATRIGATIDALAGSAVNVPGTELILVDDGSDDSTAEIAEKTLADAGMTATVLRLDRNRGKGAAVRAGVLASTGDVIAFTDADLSAGVEEILRC